MQQVWIAFTDPSLLIELAISLTALSVMCMLIYAMRWLPGKSITQEDELEDSAGVAAIASGKAESCIVVDADVLLGTESEKPMTAAVD